MAHLIGNIFGNLKGKIGNFSARTINGRTIICARLSHFKTSNSLKSVETRQRFAVTIAFASNVFSLPTLKEIWKPKKKSKMSIFNIIFKSNLYLSSKDAPTLNNIITPAGFNPPVLMIDIFAGNLIGSLAGLKSVKTITMEEASVSINAVICFLNPKLETDPFYKIISLSKEIADFNFGKQYDFEIELNSLDAEQITKYNQKIIYLAVATKTSNGRVVQYSETYSKIFN